MKTCTKCGLVKDVSEFGPHDGMADGLQPQCRVCRNAWKASRDPAVKRLERQAYRDRHRDRHLAQKAVRKAVARGTLVRPSVCDACGGGGDIQAHHADYSQRLDVRWLCIRCHADTHMARQRVDLRLPEELVAAVDAARGDVTRTRWIERALEAALPVRVDGTEQTREIAPRSPAPEDVAVARRAELQTAHRPTCKCAVCKPT